MFWLAAEFTVKFGSTPKGGFPWRDSAVVVAALASPIVSIFVAHWVTSRTINNDRTQRALDRNAERRQQLHDRQLTASADFAHAAHTARVAVVDADPSAVTVGPLLDTTDQSVDDARLALARIQLLFRTENENVSAAAEALVDSLASGFSALRRAHEVQAQLVNIASDRRRPLLKQLANAQKDYAEAVDGAKTSYLEFTSEAATNLSSTA